jgi:hypothetical protein
MATRSWSVNTVRRRLVELNRFAGWLVRDADHGAALEIAALGARSSRSWPTVPRRERRLPRVLDWAGRRGGRCGGARALQTSTTTCLVMRPRQLAVGE